MAKKMVIPCELKADFRQRAYILLFKAYLYETREEYGAAMALKLYERVNKRDNRTKRLTNSLLTIFKIKGNDVETIAQWWDIWSELNGFETTWLERSKTIARLKVTKCPFKTEPKDVSDWSLIWHNIVVKTINPKATFERPKSMCAGDPYCEYIFKIEE